MTHLGQRLSALIDGELEGNERERVLVHMTKCTACREEVAALRTLKRRMNALGDTAAGAAMNGLAGRLMELSRTTWPQAPSGSGPASSGPAGSGPAGSAPAGSAPACSGADSASPWPDPAPWRQGCDLDEYRPARPEQRAGKYFLAGTLAVFLAGLGTAAFVAGGEPQPQAPTRPVPPSVDVFVVPHPEGGQGSQPSPLPSAVRSPAQLGSAQSRP